MNVRHPLAAVLGVAGIVVGAIAAMDAPASAAGDELVATTTFNCTSSFPAYPWNGEITLSAVRPASSTTVTVTASMSQMAGVSPAEMNNLAFTNSLALTLGGTAVTLTGSGTVTAAASSPFDMPDLQGTFTSSADDVAAVVTSYSFEITAYHLAFTCTPTAGAALGTLTLAEGTPPVITPSVTPTTTTSATATPTASPTASSSANTGKAASGKVAFACTLSIGSAFDYDAKVSVSGYREDEGDPVSLVATMSDLPGIAPVPINGQMDFTLDVSVGGKKTTLTSSSAVDVAAKEEVPVADLSGEVDADGDELAVTVSGFTFDTPSLGVGAECEADAVSLGTMRVGSEPVDVASPTADSSSTASGGDLPKTGGGDSMPVVALWAMALTLLGVAGLLCVPRTRRQH
ncbi:hypothetical protein ASC77_05320 [Nocardioides sp. Root1257]|uniref:hypothetical protein n=1 Tax=unclassified Nocardioides TaxID=2615069 RepID=UPI0006FAA403|nr:MULTISPECIES: hypothetical protein [unclassified Nocardioides]KQW53687.1 hypothetical protein ASC77_05320 [Nocardioides sp. Root1257]KRC56373.1 hypothetical protein ASE24_05320 [Nocardioides sp. Root224]